MTERKVRNTPSPRSIQKAADGTFTVGGVHGIPDLPASDIGEIAAWFLGPKAENADLLREMIAQAVEKTIQYRQSFAPGDPAVITDKLRQTDGYRQEVANMQAAYAELVDFLQRYATP